MDGNLGVKGGLVHDMREFRFFCSASSLRHVGLELCDVAPGSCHSLVPVSLAVQVDKAWISTPF